MDSAVQGHDLVRDTPITLVRGASTVAFSAQVAPADVQVVRLTRTP